MNIRPEYPKIIFAALLLLLISLSELRSNDKWPNRVLITNDNGIGDSKIIALAEAFSKIAETWVIAPAEDKSGSTHFLGSVNTGSVNIERRNIIEKVKIYAVDGYPADCVVLALTGIMKENMPDLVISGINGGPNLGKDWMGSGTIGAARIASFAGIPAIAVSGLDSQIPGAVDSAANWVVRFAQSTVVRVLKPPQYLTVSIPRLPPTEIKGIKIASRAKLAEIPVFSRTSVSADSVQEMWRITGTERLRSEPDLNSDTYLYGKGYIVIVPMLADEVNHSTLDSLKNNINKIPVWKK